MKKTARFTVTTGLLAAMFSTVAYAGQTSEIETIDLDTPNVYVGQPFAPTKESSTSTPQPWGIEHEEEMRRDVKAFVSFMLNKIMPVMQNGDSLVKGVSNNDPGVQKRYAFERQKFEMFDRLLSGCYGEPGLADYAWVANTMASWNQVGNEMNHTKDHAIGKGYKTSLSHQEWQQLDKEFKRYYQNNTRWVWELNNAFFEQHPEVKQRLEDLHYKGYAINEVFDSSADGSAKVIYFEAEHVFAAHSGFMADSAFAAKIKAMNDTPVMEYRQKDQELQKKEGRFLQPSVIWDFDHSMACKKPAP